MSPTANADRFDSRDDLELGFQEVGRPTSQLNLIPPPHLFSTDGVDESSQSEMANASPTIEPARDIPLIQKERAARRGLPNTLIIFLKIVLLTALLALNVACGVKLAEMTNDRNSTVDNAEAAGWITAQFCLLFFPLVPAIYVGARAMDPQASTRRRIIGQIAALLCLAMAIYLPFGLLYNRLRRY